MAKRIGLKAKAYFLSTGTRATWGAADANGMAAGPAPDNLTEMTNVRDLTLNLSTGEADVTTRWSSAAYPGAPSDPLPTDPDWAGGSLYTDERDRAVRADPADLWRVVEGIGGEHGWYSFPLAWAVRGRLDRLSGGVGLRRARRPQRRRRQQDRGQDPPAGVRSPHGPTVLPRASRRQRRGLHSVPWAPMV